MVLPTSDALIPCLMGGCSAETRRIWKERYRTAKKYGIRTTFTGVAGASAVSLLKEAAQDTVKRHGKRYLGMILLNAGATFITAGVPLLTNATKIVRYAKACHSVCAASWRLAHNVAELPFICIDFAVFGEYVPSCGESDYDVYIKTTDIFEPFT